MVRQFATQLSNSLSWRGRGRCTQVATPAAPYRSLPGRPGPGIPKESPKSLPGAFQPWGPKVSETVSKQSPESQNRLFYPLREAIFPTRERENGLCRGFSLKKAVSPFSRRIGPWGRKAPGDSLETLSGFRARRALWRLLQGAAGVATVYCTDWYCQEALRGKNAAILKTRKCSDFPPCQGKVP